MTDSVECYMCNKTLCIPVQFINFHNEQAPMTEKCHTAKVCFMCAVKELQLDTSQETRSDVYSCPICKAPETTTSSKKITFKSHTQLDEYTVSLLDSNGITTTCSCGGVFETQRELLHHVQDNCPMHSIIYKCGTVGRIDKLYEHVNTCKKCWDKFVIVCKYCNSHFLRGQTADHLKTCGKLFVASLHPVQEIYDSIVSLQESKTLSKYILENLVKSSDESVQKIVLKHEKTLLSDLELYYRQKINTETNKYRTSTMRLDKKDKKTLKYKKSITSLDQLTF